MLGERARTHSERYRSRITQIKSLHAVAGDTFIHWQTAWRVPQPTEIVGQQKPGWQTCGRVAGEKQTA